MSVCLLLNIFLVILVGPGTAAIDPIEVIQRDDVSVEEPKEKFYRRRPTTGHDWITSWIMTSLTSVK